MSIVRPELKRSALAAIGLALLGFQGLFAAAPVSSKSILVIHEGAIQGPYNVLANAELEHALGADGNPKFQLFHEYLDDLRLTLDGGVTAGIIREKYWGARRPDVIIAMGTGAVRLMRDHGETHFDRIPVVFLLNSDRFVSPDALPPNMTGVSTHFDMAGTLELALRLHPGTRQVFFVGGSSQIEQRYKELFQSEVAPRLKGIEVTYLDGLPLGELLTRLGKLPEHSLVYQHLLMKDREGNMYAPAQVTSLAVAAANRPVYSASPLLFGSGVVGGRFFDVEDNTRRAANMALRVLKGERAEDIPREYSRFVTAVDWRQLQRLHIQESRLPPGTSILFREPTFWELYKWRVIAAIALSLFQTILIGRLLIERKRRRKAREALGNAERAWGESEERFQSLADTAPVMIWVSGPDQLYSFFNKAWLAFTGRTMEQELGQGWRQGVHPDELERCYSTYASAFEARRNFQMEYRLRQANGEYRWVLDSGVPRFQNSGEFAGYVGSCIDINDVKRIQEEAFAGQKLESMGLLASGIAHDFNNVLSGILALTEIVADNLNEGSSPDEGLLKIRSAAFCGAEIVRQLMIYVGEDGSDCEPVDISSVIDEMLAVLKLSISKPATVNVSLARHLPLVQANRAQIRQVIMNLVINASQALGPQKGEIRISTALVTVGHSVSVGDASSLAGSDYVQLEVSDTGSGMTEETRTRVFDPFFSTKPSGRGLGLAVVEGIIRAHGGAITLASTPGEGSTFQILLPCIASKERKAYSPIAAPV